MPTYEEWKKDNWSRAHREQDMSALTGTSLAGHLCTLGTQELLREDTSLLCIGAGDGKWVGEAFARVAHVEVLDVTGSAGRNLPEGVRLHTSPWLLPQGVFDLAMSLWVAPHMSNHDLENQLCMVFRSLKPGGVLAMHYKEPLDPSVPLDNLEGTDQEYRRAEAANMLRRREHFRQLVEWNGGRVLKIVQANVSQFHKVIEVSIHLTRR